VPCADSNLLPMAVRRRHPQWPQAGGFASESTRRFLRSAGAVREIFFGHGGNPCRQGSDREKSACSVPWACTADTVDQADASVASVGGGLAGRTGLCAKRVETTPATHQAWLRSCFVIEKSGRVSSRTLQNSLFAQIDFFDQPA